LRRGETFALFGQDALPLSLAALPSYLLCEVSVRVVKRAEESLSLWLKAAL